MDASLFPIMLPLFPSIILILLVGPSIPTPSVSRVLQVRDHRTPRNAEQDSIKVVISEGCSSQGDSSDVSQGGKEIDLAPGSPLVLTHKIKLVPSGSGSCGCNADFAALRERLESLEREVSDLRGKCKEAGGSCCTSESKDAGCSIKPENEECPNECSDQGRCVDGKCVCFAGYSGSDCSESNCPENCNDNGRCVDGECVCNPGFTDADCSQKACPDNCNNHGRCVNGKCVCHTGFIGPSCVENTCPRNCNRRGRCVNGQCVCNSGFTGPDCSKRTCPSFCNNRGKCFNGKCVCDAGFSGADCSEITCPGNCNNRGRCVNWQCVCDEGFTGRDCLEKACPLDCNDHGRCVDGKCVCNNGFTGTDCSEITCPGNCNNSGRCINGQCVCDSGFTGADCSEKTCPSNCSNRGRCVDGRCVCENEFTGNDCSDHTCPDNCNNRGRCINGQCICNEGFTGANCSEQTCPNDCNNHGRCVNGKCVCEVEFTGPDCSTRGCPNDCSNKGRCTNGKCVCRRGFTGQDCSQCKEGMTGPNCNIAMTSVSQLMVQDFTESSATLIWTQPLVEYETYHITFTSQKETDQQITLQVDGSLTTFTQTGLAAGQEYIVSIAGEINGRRGVESTTEFMTLISSPMNLQVVKTTSTSAVVQWEQAQGQIDRYRLTITPNDGAGRTQEMTVEASQSSAHIQQLEAGRLYDVMLVAEKGVVRSQPATTQVVPGTTFPRGSMEDVTKQVTQAPGQDFGSTSRDSVSSMIAKTKPLVNKVAARNYTRPKIRRPVLPKQGMFHSNATRALPERRFVSDSLQKKTILLKKGNLTDNNKTKPDDQIIRKSVEDQSKETSSFDSRDNQSPTVLPANNFETNGESTSAEPFYTGLKQPDTGVTDAENDTHSVSSEKTRNIPGQEKKCMNKIKLTHFKLPVKNRGNGCSEDGVGLRENAFSSSTEEISLNKDKDFDYTPDPLHRLITDTFDDLNITTISVLLTRPLNLSANAEMVRKQILKGIPSLTSSSLTAQSSYLSIPKTSSPAAEPLSASKHAISFSQSFLSPSSTSSSSLSLPSPSSNSTSLDDFDSKENNKLDSTAHSAPTTEQSNTPRFHHSTPKKGFIRRLYPKFDLLRNKTRQGLRVSIHSSPHLNQTLIKETKNESSPSSFSASRKSPLLGVDQPVKNGNREGDRDAITTNTFSGVEENKHKMLTDRRHYPFRRPPIKGSYPRRLPPNLHNRTRPISKLLTQASQSLHPKTHTLKQQMFPTEMITVSTSLSKDSLPSDTVSIIEGNDTRVMTRENKTTIPIDFNQTSRERTVPSSLQPYIRRLHKHRESIQNKTFMNLQRRKNPQQGSIRRPLFVIKQNGGTFIFGSQTNEPEKEEKDSAIDNHKSQSGTSHRLMSSFATNQSREQVNGMLNQSALMHAHKTNAAIQTRELENRNTILVQLEATSDSGNEERYNTDRDTDATDQSITFVKADLKSSGPVTLPNTQPTSKTSIGQNHGIKSVNGIHKKELSKTNHTLETVLDSEIEGIDGPATEVSYPGDKRQPLDFVGMKNRPSDDINMMDPHKGKYSRAKGEIGESSKQKENKQEQDKVQYTKEFSSENIDDKDNNKVPDVLQVSTTLKETVDSEMEAENTFRQGPPGSDRPFQVEHPPPQTDHSITLLGNAPGILSRLHKLVISTGPEPPSNIVFSKVTETSLTVSWTKPTSPVNGFKVTYTHSDDGEPVSVTVGSQDSALDLSRLSPGSSYEVTIISTLGLDESDPIKDSVITLPDLPTDLKTVNVTDTTALLLWRPALATVDEYAIVYGAGTGSEIRVLVSGNSAEQQLSGLTGSTTYTVTVTSLLGSLESSPTTTSFTTKSGSGWDYNEAQDLKASNVTPRSAVVSWTPSSKPVDKCILVYGIKGENPKEVIISPNLTQYKLNRLDPGSLYSVELRSIRGGELTANSNTEFTTGTLRFPFPTDCSQEMLNGIFNSDVVEIFPQGKFGKSMNVYCDMETEGGGWTVFQRRKDGSLDFYKGWRDYVSGFGNLSGEFWLGLEKIHNLTKMTKMNLRVDLQDEAERVFAKYSTFEVSRKIYKLSVGGYSGTAGDSLSYHNNCVFSTKDRDPAPWITRCAISYQGGWWYKNCHEANLNGLYGIDFKHQGLIWKSWKGEKHSIQFTEMKMRPASFRSPVTRAK